MFGCCKPKTAEDTGAVSEQFKDSNGNHTHRTNNEHEKHQPQYHNPVEALPRLSPEDKVQQELFGNQLHAECKNSKGPSISQMESIIQECPNSIYFSNHLGEIALHLLCKHAPNGKGALEYLLGLWPDSIQQATKDSQSLPLHLACEGEADSDILFYLMGLFGGAVSRSNDLGMLPLHLACDHNADASVVEALIRQEKKTLYQKTSGGYLPIHLACEFPNLAVITKLVKSWKDCLEEPNSSSSQGDGNLPLHIACANSAPLPVIEYLVSKNPDTLKTKNQKGDQALHLACKSSKNFKVIKYLVQENPQSMTTNNRNGNLPIHIACGNKTGSRVVKFLVGKSPESLKRATNEGLLSLHVACQVKASLKLISFLVKEHPGSVQEVTNDGRLPIHIACEKQLHLETIQYLIKAWPGSVHCCDTNRHTPLDMVKQEGKDDHDPDIDVVTWMERYMAGEVILPESEEEEDDEEE